MDYWLITRTGGGQLKHRKMEDYDSPQEAVDDYDGPNTPIAWTTACPERRLPQALEDAQKAGQTIDEDRVVNVAPAPAPFRFGGIYRQRDGQLMRLDRTPWGHADGEKWAREDRGYATMMKNGLPCGNDGARQLSDGKYPGFLNDPHYRSHLIPGELDIHGNPVNHLTVAEKDKLRMLPKPATLTESTDPRDIAMMKRDGPARGKPVPATPAPIVRSTAKPCPWATLSSPDLAPSSHQIDPLHASLARRS